MADQRLKTLVPRAADGFYLDTSAVQSLLVSHLIAKGFPGGETEKSREAAMRTFLSKCSAAGATVRTSILAIQELAAVARRATRDNLARKKGFTDWRHLEKVNDTLATSLQQDVIAVVHATGSKALSELNNTGVVLETPAVSDDGVVSIPTKWANHHLALTRKYPSCDPMDLLHIILGVSMGSDLFVSFDKAWRPVSEITVYW